MNRRERLLCFLASIGLAVLLVMVMAKISEMRLVPPVVLPPRSASGRR
jgi:hypothetical protein